MIQTYLPLAALILAATCGTAGANGPAPDPAAASRVQTTIDTPHLRRVTAQLQTGTTASTLDVKVCQRSRRSSIQRYRLDVTFLSADGAVLDHHVSELKIAPRSPDLPPPCAFVTLTSRPDVASAKVRASSP